MMDEPIRRQWAEHLRLVIHYTSMPPEQAFLAPVRLAKKEALTLHSQGRLKYFEFDEAALRPTLARAIIHNEAVADKS